MNISENEQVVEIEIVNKLVRGNIALTKVDAEYTDTKLTGAVFEVYKDSNDNGELSEYHVNEELAKKWLSNGAQPTETVARIFKSAGIEK